MERTNTFRKIGFTTKYYTLWQVSEYDDRYYYEYLQNLSFDEQTAIEKAGTDDIDLTLRGATSFWKSKEHVDKGINTVLRFGKYIGKTLGEVITEDSQYLLWLSTSSYDTTLRNILNSLNELQEIKNRLEAEKIERERILAEERAKSQYVGEVGKRQVFEVEINHVIMIETEFGYSNYIYIYIMKDENGNTLVWKTSNGVLEKGSKYSLTATVKEHKDYKGEKQTVLTRCRLPKVEVKNQWGETVLV